MLKLDERDLELLKVLSREGRISKADLAKRINLSPSPCWKRLKRLENSGIIQGYSAEVSLRKLVPFVTVFVMVELEHHQAAHFQKFERAVGDVAEVVACWAIGGGMDYLMQVVSRDIDSYQRLMDALLDRDLSILRYFTYVVTKQVKQNTGLPFDALLAGQIEAENAPDDGE